MIAIYAFYFRKIFYKICDASKYIVYSIATNVIYTFIIILIDLNLRIVIATWTALTELRVCIRLILP